MLLLHTHTNTSTAKIEEIYASIDVAWVYVKRRCFTVRRYEKIKCAMVMLCPFHRPLRCRRHRRISHLDWFCFSSDAWLYICRKHSCTHSLTLTLAHVRHIYGTILGHWSTLFASGILPELHLNQTLNLTGNHFDSDGGCRRRWRIFEWSELRLLFLILCIYYLRKCVCEYTAYNIFIANDANKVFWELLDIPRDIAIKV